MKKLAYILAAVALLSACVAEKIEHPTEAQAPQTASVYNPTVSVDQATNQVTFSLGEKAVVPVWVFQNNQGEWAEYHTGDGFKKIFAASGEFGVRMYVMNAAGTTPDFVEKSFTIENTLMDFSKYIRYISGGSEKTWRVNNAVDGHMGCGESVSNPTNWWSATPDNKKDFGVYENRMTFSSEGVYTFDPGESGTVYVNIDGVTDSKYTAYKGDATADYTVPVEAASCKYQFAVAGNDVLLKLDNGALFPYIPNDDFISNTEFHLLSLDNNAMTLVMWNGGIAWQVILTSKAGETTFNGFNYNADSNLWKGADADGGLEVGYYYAPGWSQLPDPVMEHSGNKYSWNLPSATQDRWQAQMFLVPTTAISLSADKTYDFSCILSTSADLTAKVKLHRMDEGGSDADNAAAVVDADVPVKAGEDVVFFLTDLPGVDAGNIRLVLDWGGNPDNADVSISRIVLKDHAVDDGTVLPEDNPGGGEEPGETYTYGPNLLTDLYLDSTWFSAADWSGGLDPQASFEGGKLTLTVPDGVGGSEWQGQVKLVSQIPADPEKQYAFFAKIESSEDGVATVKLADANDDSNHAFFHDNTAALSSSAPLAYKKEPVFPDQAYEAVMVIFDLGRMPAGTEITVTGIELKEITGTNSGSQGGGLVEGENLWAAAEVNMSYWYSDASWSGQLAPVDPEILAGNGLKVTMPDGIGGSEWQGQNAFHAPGIFASVDKEYDFWMTLEADEDMTVTVKLAWEGHDVTNAFFYDNNVKLTAGEPLKYVRAAIKTDDGSEERNDYDGIVLFVDSGRSPAGSELVMSDIHFQEHIGGTPDTPETPEEDYTTNDPSIPGDYFDVAGAGNLWRGATITNSYWYSAADWSGQLQPVVFPADDWGGLKVIIPEGIGGNEWQGQTMWHTDIPATTDAAYAFCVTVKSDEDINGLTFKLAWEGNDNDHALFYVNDAKIKAGVPYTFKMKDLVPDVDYDKLVLFIDCGRCKVGTAVSFTNFCLQKTGDVATPGENLWTDPEIGYWFSPADWSGGLEPEYAYADGVFTLTVPDGVGGSEWQGQVKMTIPVAVSATSAYVFSCKLLADDNVTVTIKLADANDDSNHAFFYDPNVNLTADTPLTYAQDTTSPDQDYEATMLIFDFGRCPAGTLIKVSDFELREVK